MFSSAPSVCIVAGPETAIHLNWFCGSTTISAARGSRRKCRSFARPTAVLIQISPSFSSNQTTVECGEPSRRSVVTTPGNGLSRMNARCAAVKVAKRLLSQALRDGRRDALDLARLDVGLDLLDLRGNFLRRARAEL